MSRNASYVFDTALQLSHTTAFSTHAHTHMHTLHTLHVHHATESDNLASSVNH